MHLINSYKQIQLSCANVVILAALVAVLVLAIHTIVKVEKGKVNQTVATTFLVVAFAFSTPTILSFINSMIAFSKAILNSLK